MHDWVMKGPAAIKTTLPAPEALLGGEGCGGAEVDDLCLETLSGSGPELLWP